MSKNYPLSLGKQTWEQLENIHRFGYSYSTIFSDFLDTCLFFLLSLTDNHIRKSFEELMNLKFDGKHEDQYMQIIEKYRENKGHCSADSEIAIDRADDRFYTTGPNLLLLRGAHQVRTG